MVSHAYGEVLTGVRELSSLPPLYEDENPDLEYVPPGEAGTAAPYTAHDGLATAGVYSCVGVRIGSVEDGMEFLTHTRPGDVENGRNPFLEEFLDTLDSSGESFEVEVTYAVARTVDEGSSPDSTRELLRASRKSLDDVDSIKVSEETVTVQQPPASLAIKPDDDTIYSYVRREV
ncbi:MAG: hypothetical protein SVQ76_01150 [Candidatus Nanohaloarchaea archaeon]|nr:hypothetical protein [Candidatus Nanohaloarchaea archaeon]